MPSAAESGNRRAEIVVPTYHEVENIPHLVHRIRALRDATAWDLRVLLMDDSSNDGSAELVASLDLPGRG